MTEQEWLKCEDPQRMLTVSNEGGKVFLNTSPNTLPVSDRKLRLFACAGWRLAISVDPSFAAKGIRLTLDTAIDLAEAHADGQHVALPSLAWSVCGCEPGPAAFITAMPSSCVGKRVAAPAIAWLLRDIVGNPFQVRDILVPPLGLYRRGWLSPTIQQMAKDIYEERDWSLLPILADALEEAGGGNVGDLPDHLRSPGPHVRGCWALDLVLGKV